MSTAANQPPHDIARIGDAVLHGAVQGIRVAEDQLHKVVFGDVKGFANVCFEIGSEERWAAELHGVRFAGEDNSLAY